MRITLKQLRNVIAEVALTEAAAANHRAVFAQVGTALVNAAGDLERVAKELETQGGDAAELQAIADAISALDARLLAFSRGSRA